MKVGKGKPIALIFLFLGLMLAGLLMAGQPALAQEEGKIDSGDTAWILISSAIVLAMTAPGLALFYGGMARRKNALSTMMYCFIALCLVSVQWVLWGYTLAFGPDVGKLIGGLDYLGLKGLSTRPSARSPIWPSCPFSSCSP